MKTLLIYLPFVISLLIGYLFIHILFLKHSLERMLKLMLAGGLGLGLSAYINFFSLIFLNRFQPTALLIIHGIVFLALSILLLFLIKKNNLPLITFQPKDAFNVIPLILIIGASVPLWYQAHFYAYGGWDAWQVWNLKAKFIFLGAENWKNMFDPILWRSSPHYPLLFPLVNVWGWVFQSEAIYKVPVFSSYAYTILGLGLLYYSLKHLTQSVYAILIAFIFLSLPLLNKLSYSQYSDNIVGFYLLASFFSLIMAKTENNKSFALLGGIFLGLLSFSKSEGYLASLVILFLTPVFFFWKNKEANKKRLLIPFFLGAFFAFLPTIIFEIFYSPNNQTFVNGLTSPTKPITLNRIKTVFGFYFFEMCAPLWNAFYKMVGKTMGEFTYLEPKWNGLWVIVFIGLIMSRLKCLSSKIIIIPIFLLCYTGIVTFYYFLNTYFEIGWWLQNTLHRILFAVLPTILFWVYYSLWESQKISVGKKTVS